MDGLTTKPCKKCGRVLPLNEFYVHLAMRDGHLNHCRMCVIDRVSIYRAANIEEIRSYDLRRAGQPHRKQHQAEVSARARALRPEADGARTKVNNAVRDGLLEKPGLCSMCGATDVRLYGHHNDYAKPLDVSWLCQPCHAALHKPVAVDEFAVETALEVKRGATMTVQQADEQEEADCHCWGES